MKRILVLVSIAFLVYFLVKEPTVLADIISDIGGFFGAGFESIIDFFDRLFS